MFHRPTLCLALTLTALLGACTPQEKKVLNELENMPGITCTTSKQEVTTCGPDSLPATEGNQ